MGESIPGLPSWVRRRRSSGPPSSSQVWGKEQPTGSHGLSKLTDVEDPPGVHLPRKVRERILDGYYVDIFSLLKPENDTGVTGTKRDKDGAATGSADRTFLNWMKGYSVYMALVSAAFPERGWHLANHLSNVLRAKTLAGDLPAIAYDEAFRQRASHNGLARWDLCNNGIWLETVGPHARARVDTEKRKGSFRREGSRRVCWEFNQGKCHRPRCKYEHHCELCFGAHAKMACNRSAGAQQPFRGARPPGGSGGKREGGSGNAGSTVAASK